MGNYKTDNLIEKHERQFALTASYIQEDGVRKDPVFLKKKEFLLNPLFLKIADIRKIGMAIQKIEETEKQNLVKNIRETENPNPLSLRLENTRDTKINFRELQEKELSNTCPEMVRYFLKQKGGDKNEHN